MNIDMFSGIQNYFTKLFYGDNFDIVELNEIVFGLNYKVFDKEDVLDFIERENAKFCECSSYREVLERLRKYVVMKQDKCFMSYECPMSIVKQISPSMMSYGVIGVQPMSGPTGTVYKMVSNTTHG